MHAVAMAMGLVKNKALIMVFGYLNKIQSLDCFLSFAHYELTLNPFCQHCSKKKFDIGDFRNSPIIVSCIIKNYLCQNSDFS